MIYKFRTNWASRIYFNIISPSDGKFFLLFPIRITKNKFWSTVSKIYLTEITFKETHNFSFTKYIFFYFIFLKSTYHWFEIGILVFLIFASVFLSFIQIFQIEFGFFKIFKFEDSQKDKFWSLTKMLVDNLSTIVYNQIDNITVRHSVKQKGSIHFIPQLVFLIVKWSNRSRTEFYISKVSAWKYLYQHCIPVTQVAATRG